jgi:hypothetical protein
VVGLPTGDPGSVVLVGVGNTAVMFFLELVFGGTGSFLINQEDAKVKKPVAYK